MNADDFTVTATNTVGNSAGADDEYMTVSPGSQALEQEIGMSFDTSTDTATITDTSANLETANSSGVVSVVPSPLAPLTRLTTALRWH